ncbi:exodeoxyribonuclease III [Ornithinimicrobium sp. W1665]|uniref:exodeoxyribonuclease III n=1 Tax=Ornithinimicrobium sp. W1665 TaxID=3416666 RepID=UPI003D6AF098
MRIATWNCNSIRSRVDRAVAFLERHDVDVLALQETKCKDEQFPHLPFEAAGYEVAHVGYHQWNGVAVVSRVGLEDVQVGFEGMPTWGEGQEATTEARAISAVAGGVRVWSLYVPNGRSLDDPHLLYKLDWLAALREAGEAWLAEEPGAQIALTGDWNIAPTDEDVWSVEHYLGRTHTGGGAGRLLRRRGRRLHGRRPAPRPRTGHLHLLGLHPAGLPQAPRDADRLLPRVPGPVRPGGRGVHRPRGAQGQGRQRPRPGGRRPDRRVRTRSAAQRAPARTASRKVDGEHDLTDA